MLDKTEMRVALLGLYSEFVYIRSIDIVKSEKITKGEKMTKIDKVKKGELIENMAKVWHY